MTFETIRTMLVGYARVSTNEQTLDLQKDALEKIGCTKIYSDVVSGAKEERKGLNWLRVLDTTERSQVDQRVRHQLHRIVSLLDAFKAEQQPLELVFPRKGPLDPHA